ncbi:MAG TPA: DEAD/DEAH box helicase, partial [Synergistales bacterium]|nr:DEAD/DEAH box helicase [Synergistales bacterium]
MVNRYARRRCVQGQNCFREGDAGARRVLRGLSGANVARNPALPPVARDRRALLASGGNVRPCDGRRKHGHHVHSEREDAGLSAADSAGDPGGFEDAGDLFIPTKALASDQFRALSPLLEHFGAGRVQAGIYDGDTPPNERSRIRGSANIILTNPEMLNATFLPNHGSFGFNFLFANLKYVVVDELHSYRGAFGSHLANLMKRLARICRYYGSSPRFLCSSATIANPVELAEKICGAPFSLVSKDGSPAPEKRYYLWQPPLVKGGAFRISPAREATGLIAQLVLRKSSFLAFCKSRNAVEVVLKESR